MQTHEELLLQLFAIFLGAKIAGELFERLKLPGVLGEILAGILLGPYALGWIHPHEAIRSLSEIGIIFVLFNAGLETSPQDLIRVGRKALVVAVAGVILPLAMGFAYMRWRGNSLMESVFVGAAMVATSVGITARVLGDLGLLATRTAKIILGAAVFDDILGMLLLAIVGGLAQSGRVEWLHLGVLAGESAFFALFLIFLGPRLIRRLRPGLAYLSTSHAPFVLALLTCLFLSWLAARIGMAAIIGAFFAGMIFADCSPEWSLKNHVGAITEFLGPFFFFSIGAQLDPHLFSSGILWTALVISLLAIFSKLAGCGLPLLGEGWRPVFEVGIGMVPRGEVALIVALVGLNSNIVSQSTYAIVVFMTAVTTILAPPLLRYLFRTQREEPVPVVVERQL